VRFQVLLETVPAKAFALTPTVEPFKRHPFDFIVEVVDMPEVVRNAVVSVMTD